MNVEKDRNLWLDIIRGISALAVCLGHLRNVLLVDYGALVNPGILLKALYAITSFGHQSVMVFFVLSGYFVGGGVLRAGVKFMWRDYLSSRLTRLWVVLIPCLVLTWCIDQIVNSYAPLALSGSNFDIWHSGPKPGEYSASVPTFIGNLFFLQTILSPVFGSNGPLWSLANEFWYYMLFPLIVFTLGIAGSEKLVFRGLSFVFMALLLWWLPYNVLDGFVIWMMGVAIYLLQPWIRSLKPALVTAVGGFGLLQFSLALGYSKSNQWIERMDINPDLLVGLTFSILCLAMTSRPFPESRYPVVAFLSRTLSEMSYSLYISHFPLVILIASIAYGSAKLMPTGVVLAQFMGWCFVLIGFGFLVYWSFESRTFRIRTIVRNWIEPSRRLPT